MILKHIIDLVTVLSLYLILALALYGWGLVGARALSLDDTKIKAPFSIIWLGFAIIVFLFQLLNLWFPLDWRISLLVYGMGLAWSVPAIFRAIRDSKEISRPDLVLYLLIIMIAASFIASRSMLPPSNGDSGLYHFNAIRWINSYSIVPGLANLHGRLAYNQSFFTYVASLNFFPYFPHGHNVANSFLFCLVFSQIILQLLTFYRKGRSLLNSDPVLFLPPLLILPILIYYPARWDWLSSPTPDVVSILIQLFIFLTFARMAYDTFEGKCSETDAAVVIILSVTAATIKLSNLGFSIAVITVSFYWLYVFSTDRVLLLKKLIRLCMVCGGILTVWVTRGYILSGYPLFPSSIGGLPFDWAMPLESVKNEANWVYSWARLPSVHWNKVLGNWDWLGPWFRSLFDNGERALYPALCAIIQIIVLAVVILNYKYTKKNTPRITGAVLLIPPLTGIFFWFFTAPDPRFANALFWLLSIASSVVLLSYLHQIMSHCRYVWVLCTVFVFTNLGFFIFPAIKVYQKRPMFNMVAGDSRISSGAHTQNTDIGPANNKVLDRINSALIPAQKKILGLSVSGFHDIPESPIVQKNTLSGLVINTPITNGMSWDSGLPCTPFFNEKLRLRIPGRIDSGFLSENSTGP